MKPLIPRPPEEYILRIGGIFEIGDIFVEYFKKYCHLKPFEKVLEIGCGVGRMAIPLASYLDSQGEYHGMDIVREFIDWDTRNVTTRYPNFKFYWANVKNGFYNPHGSVPAKNFHFPFKDGYFDLIMLISVFTHLQNEDFIHYVSEVSRLLKTGGRCFATFFLLNGTQRELNKKGKNQIVFPVSENALSYLPGIKELAVAIEENFVHDIFTGFSLKISDPILYGAWSGRNDWVSYQDMVIAQKVHPGG